MMYFGVRKKIPMKNNTAVDRSLAVRLIRSNYFACLKLLTISLKDNRDKKGKIIIMPSITFSCNQLLCFSTSVTISRNRNDPPPKYNFWQMSKSTFEQRATLTY